MKNKKLLEKRERFSLKLISLRADLKLSEDPYWSTRINREWVEEDISATEAEIRDIDELLAEMS